MPTREELLEAFRRQEAMVDEVKQLRQAEERRTSSDRRWRIAMIAIAALVVISVVFGIIALQSSHDAKQAGRTAKAAVASVADAATRSRIEACQIRNYSARDTRRAIDENTQITYNRFAELFTNLKSQIPPDSPLAKFLDAELAIPPVDVTKPDAEVDSDCNQDGTVDASDYPPGS